MRILIDIGHPAHVHYFRNLAMELEASGHTLIWTVKEIDVAKKLLTYYGFPYIVLKKKTDGLLGKAFKQIYYDLKLLSICRKEKIDLAIGTSISIAHVSQISKVKSFFFEDDDDKVVPLSAKFGHPFATHLLSPDCLRSKQNRKDTIYYPSYHELSYLHPKRFTPDATVLQETGMKEGETFFIMRFNVFKAHHDVGIRGLSLEQKMELIMKLKTRGKVFITTEREIEPELIEYQLKLSPEKIHSLMAYATLFLGDSQTMTSEAAMLGIPSLRCNSFAGRISYLEEQEKKYSLTFAFLPEHFDLMVLKLHELLSNTNLKKEWQKKRQKMLGDKIDVTSFWTWFIDNYPGSINKIQNSPDFFNKFR
jgi:predicted glycosyltransferase